MLDTIKWRTWLGPRPLIYLNSIDGGQPAASTTNLIGLAHDLLDEIERLRSIANDTEEELDATRESRAYWRSRCQENEDGA